MSRINKATAESIVLDILRHRYADDAQKFCRDYSRFAVKVYNEFYSHADRVKMNDLPKGWLPEHANISVQFGVSRNYETLQFNGNQSGKIYYMLKGKRDDDIFLRFKSKDGSRCCAQYDESHKLTQEFFTLRDRRQDLVNEIVSQEHQINAIISRYTTPSALVKAWPDILPFVQKYIEAPVLLPSVPVEELNAKLKLPPKKKKAA